MQQSTLCSTKDGYTRPWTSKREYTHHAIDLMNEHGNNNPQGL